MDEIKKVFISYAWEDKVFAEKILSFSNSLRENGIDAIIDQYEENPDQGWPIWMEKQIEISDYVLIISTKTYFEKYKQLQDGKGVTWEVSSIYQSLYNLKGHNNKFIPVIFSNLDSEFILPALQPFTHYNVTLDLQKLFNRIKGIPNTIKPLVNTIKLPEKGRKTLFISTPINIELWDKAKWMGVAFVFTPHGQLFGLKFDGDDKSVRKIFKEFSNYENLDDYLTFTFIEGDIEGLPKNGYTCLISPNIEKTIERIGKYDKIENNILLTFNRFQRMYPKDNFNYFNSFKNMVLNNPNVKFAFIPITLIDKKRETKMIIINIILIE